MIDMKAILDEHALTIDDMVAYINLKGGRPEQNPIIFKEQCGKCQSLFFSNSQDHHMRNNNGYPTECPACREVGLKKVRSNNTKKYREARKKR